MQADTTHNPETFKIKGDSNATSKQLRKEHSNRTEEEVKFKAGKESKPLGRLEKRPGKKDGK